MPLLTNLRRRPWLSGALLLILAASLAAPAAYVGGRHAWALFAGAAAALLLLFGAAERLWQRRPLPRRARAVDRSRFRVVPGGKSSEAGKRKGNGHARDDAGGEDEGGDKPRWVM